MRQTGLQTLVGGGSLLGLSLKPGAFRSTFWILFVIFLLFSGMGQQWILNRLKERVSAPRVGYVQFPGPGRIAWGVSILVGLALLCGTGLQVSLPEVKDSIQGSVSAAVIFLMAAFFGVIGFGTRRLGYVVRSLAALLMGLAVIRWHLGSIGLLWTFLVLGVLSTITGAVRLRRFLRAHARPAETTS